MKSALARNFIGADGAGPALMGCGLGRARSWITAPPAGLLQARSFADDVPGSFPLELLQARSFADGVPGGFSLSFSQTGFNSVRVKTRLCVRGSPASDAATPWTSATLARFISAERADLPQACLAARIGDAADGGFGCVHSPHSPPWRHYACNRRRGAITLHRWIPRSSATGQTRSLTPLRSRGQRLFCRGLLGPTRPLPNAVLQEWQAASATQQLQGESLVRGHIMSNVPAHVRAEIKQTLTAMALPDTAANNLDAAIAFMRTQVQTSYSKAQRDERESVIDTHGESSVSIVTKTWALRCKLTAVYASMQALLPDQHWLQSCCFISLRWIHLSMTCTDSRSRI